MSLHSKLTYPTTNILTKTYIGCSFRQQNASDFFKKYVYRDYLCLGSVSHNFEPTESPRLNSELRMTETALTVS